MRFLKRLKIFLGLKWQETKLPLLIIAICCGIISIPTTIIYHSETIRAFFYIKTVIGCIALAIALLYFSIMAIIIFIYCSYILFKWLKSNWIKAGRILDRETR